MFDEIQINESTRRKKKTLKNFEIKINIFFEKDAFFVGQKLSSWSLSRKKLDWYK